MLSRFTGLIGAIAVAACGYALPARALQLNEHAGSLRTIEVQQTPAATVEQAQYRHYGEPYGYHHRHWRAHDWNQRYWHHHYPRYGHNHWRERYSRY